MSGRSTVLMALWLQLEIKLWNLLSGNPKWVDQYKDARVDVTRAVEEGWRVERWTMDMADGYWPLAFDQEPWVNLP